jgi:hypothetical protein
MASIHQYIEPVVVSAPAPLTRQKKEPPSLASGTRGSVLRNHSLHRACEPCRLSLTEAAAALSFDKCSAQARAVNAFCLSEHTDNYIFTAD